MTKTISLNQANLSRISQMVTCPTYDRSKITTGIVHIGVGGFHRAHQALYTDDLLHNTSVTNWGICGVALLGFDKKIYNTLKKQDGLYTLIVKELDGSLTKRVIGSIVEYLFAPENPWAVIEKMAHPDVKVITLTITEGGYNRNEATGEFDTDNTSIKYDLDNSSTPKTIFGYLTQALKLRKERGLKGVTIQSCDNIQGNGDVTKKMILSYVKLTEPDLITWIKSNVSFPNSMVDRITPVTATTDILSLKQISGIEDKWPVVCEPFKQWVIEDDFIAGRPEWEKVGAEFVKDVAPYEKMKLSLLNAGHSVLGILGALVGYNTIDEVINDTNIKSFLTIFMDLEVTPSLGKLKGIDLEVYKASLLERFANQNIKDQISRICSESSAKIPKFILPTIKFQIENNESFTYSAFVLAAWARYSLGRDENGNAIERKDIMATQLREKATLSKLHPLEFLTIESIFGDLKDKANFTKAYLKAYKTITEKGIKKGIPNSSEFIIK